jgi:hypothetical protein
MESKHTLPEPLFEPVDEALEASRTGPPCFLKQQGLLYVEQAHMKTVSNVMSHENKFYYLIVNIGVVTYQFHSDNDF